MKTIRRPIETWTQIIAGFMIGLILSAFIWALITDKEPMKDNSTAEVVSIDFIYTQSNDVDNQIVWYGTNASITLSGNTIVILTDLSEGMSGNFIITQDLIGGNEFKMYPKPRICNGIFSDIILISESNSTYSVSWMYNGTDLFVNSYELE